MRFLVLALPLLAAPQDGPVELRWNLRKDARFTYRLQLHVKTASLNYDFDDTFRFTVTEVDGKGQALIRARYEEVGMKASGMQKYGFDSRKDKDTPADPNARMFSRLVGQSFTFRMTPNGRILEVSGLDAVMDEMTKDAGSEEERAMFKQSLRMFLSNDIMKSRLQQAMPGLPDKKVNSGDRWPHEAVLMLPLLGPVKCTVNSTLKELANSEARFSQEIEIGKPTTDGVDPMAGFLVIKPSRGKGEGVFSVREGRLRSFSSEAKLDFILGEQSWDATFISELRLVED